MTLRRYTRAPVVNMIDIGKFFGTSNTINIIRNNVAAGTIRKTTYVTKENERLDIIAGKVYGSGRLWWAISAASGIGWTLQVPAGTVLLIPDLEDLAQYVG